MEQNYYEILGVEPTSDLDEIKRAYRALARKYHPDGNNPDASETLFRKVSEAYSTLSSNERREKYNATLGIDQEGHTPEEHKKTRSYVFSEEDDENRPLQATDYDRPGKTSGKTSGRFSQRSDGRAGPEHDSEQGDDSILGKLTRAFTRSSSSTKESHHRQMRANEGDAESADDLDLRGDRVYQFTIDGFESLQGANRELALRTDGVPRMLRVKIPSGVSDGDILRVKVASDGEELSIPIRVTVVPHEYVEREGRDIVLRVPLTFGESLNGTELEVPTLSGPVKVRVPPLWDIRKRLRVKGRGVHRDGSEPGDLYVQLHVCPPDQEPPQVRQIAAALDEAYAVHPRLRFPLRFK